MTETPHLIHLADLHIRTGDTFKSKYDEYEIVFNRLFEDLSNHPKIIQKNAIIIIVGDIFHNKLKIESAGLKLVFTFLKNLGSISPVIIIRGNHDYRQEYPNEPDLIESVLSNDIPNVNYWNKTGHYILSNIGFGIVSIQDALLKGNPSGITPKLPKFPDPKYFDKYPQINHRIALFHGAITKTKLPNGMLMDEKHTYPLEWFEEYDAVILGDIHLQQLHGVNQIKTKNENNFKNSTEIYTYTYTDKQPWGYPGSLLQQNFGEALCGHGFLIWDLDNKQISCYHVNNDYGYISLKQNSESNDIYIAMKNQYKNNWILLENIINEPWFPSKVYTRFASKNNDENIINIIKNIFTKNKKTILNIIYQPLNNEEDTEIIDNNIDDDIIDITSFNTPNMWCEYININCKPIYENWKTWFTNFESLQLPSINNDILTNTVNSKNNIIQKNIDILQQEIDSMNNMHNIKNKFHINYIEFENILCFKGINFFNFDTSEEKNILSINAANGCGKTSFLETICISLYGKDLPSRCEKSQSSSIIYNKKKEKEKSQTTIYITINNIQFRIKRIFNFNSKDSNKLDNHSTHITLEQFNTNLNIFQQLCSSSKIVGEWVDKNIGTIESFLLSCMITQNCDQDFFNLKSEEQKELLDAALYISSSTIFHNVIKEAKLHHNTILDKVQDELLHCNINNNIKDYPIEIQILKNNIKLKNIDKTHIGKKYNSIQSKINNITNSVNLLKKGKQFIKQQLLEFDEKLESIDEEEIIEYNINTIIKDIGKYQNEIEIIDVYQDIDNYNKNDIDKKYKNVNKQLSSLPKPNNTLEYINDKNLLYNEWKLKYNTLYNNDIENIQDYINKYNLDLSNTKNNIDKLILVKDELLIKININKELLEKHILIQPLQPRNTNEEYNKWIDTLSSFTNKYKNISTLNSLYETCKNKNIIKPEISYDEIIYKFNKLKKPNITLNESDIEENKQHISIIENNINILQNKFNDNNTKLKILLKQQLNKPTKNIEEYNDWNNKLQVFKSKYSSIENIENKLDSLKSEQPEIPHTSKNQLENNLDILQKNQIKFENNFNIIDSLIEIELLKKNNIDIKNKINNLKDECESSNNLYIKTLSNKPISPQKYMNLKEYNKEYTIFSNEKNIINDYLKKFKSSINVDSNKYIIDKLEKYIIKLPELTLQFDKYNNMLSSFEDHPYNPDCPACQQQPWKLQKNNILDEIAKLKTSIENINKNIKKNVGNVEINNYISQLKTQIVNIEKYNKLTQEENEFWIIEKKRIDNLIEWETKTKTYLSKYNSIKKQLEQNIIKEIQLNKDIDNLDNDIKKYNNAIKTQNEINTCNTMIKSWNIYNNWLEEYNILLKEFNDFKRLDDSIIFWNQEIENNKIYSEWQDNIKNIELDIHNIENEIKNKNELLILYNKKQDDYQNKIIFNDYQNQINLWNKYNICNKELQYLLNEINNWNELISKTEYWDEEKERIHLAIKWKKQFDNYNINIDLLNQELYSISSDIDKLNNKIIEYKNIIENINIYNNKYIVWKTLMNDINSDNEIYNSIDKFNNEKILYDKLYKIWNNKENINDLQSICDDIKTYNEIKNLYNNYKVCYDLWDDWNIINNNYISLDIIEKDIIKYSVELSSLEKEYEKYLYNKNNKELLQNYINIITERHESLVMIHEVFGNFKKWMYSDKVIPFLQNSANNIMNKICGSRPLYIESEITHSKTGTLFSWFLKDGLSRPHIKKASGFQRHMAGFAIRIALCQIGASAIKPSQLFLDECFTSADYDNLSRVSDLLHDLCNKYQNIIIVTHIDDIKSCADKYIDITRFENESTSQLQYGEKYIQPVKENKVITKNYTLQENIVIEKPIIKKKIIKKI
jgi:DNA repair exonuclease SbcCD ATPase subunit